MQKTSDLLLKAAISFDQIAEFYIDEYEEFKAGREPHTNFYPSELDFRSCCDAISNECLLYSAITEESCFYFLNFLKPTNNTSGYWWADPYQNPKQWIKDINARILALLFAAEIAKSIGD